MNPRAIDLHQAAKHTPWGFYAYGIASRSLRSMTVLFEIGFDRKAEFSLPIALRNRFALRSLWGNACYSRPGSKTGLAAIVALIGTGEDEGLAAVNLIGPNKFPMILPISTLLPVPIEFDTLVFSFFDDLDHPTNFRWALTLHA